MSRPFPGKACKLLTWGPALAGAMLSEYQQVTSLIKYLQSMRGRRLWPHQDASLLEPNPPSNIALTALANAVSTNGSEASMHGRCSVSPGCRQGFEALWPRHDTLLLEPNTPSITLPMALSNAVTCR